MQLLTRLLIILPPAGSVPSSTQKPPVRRNTPVRLVATTADQSVKVSLSRGTGEVEIPALSLKSKSSRRKILLDLAEEVPYLVLVLTLHSTAHSLPASSDLIGDRSEALRPTSKDHCVAFTTERQGARPSDPTACAGHSGHTRSDGTVPTSFSGAAPSASSSRQGTGTRCARRDSLSRASAEHASPMLASATSTKRVDDG